MGTNFDRTAAWLTACGKLPGSDISVQFGCVLEEATELLCAVTFLGTVGMADAARALNSMKALGESLKKGELKAFIDPADRAQALDAICDIEVTLNGLAHLAIFDKNHADQLVMSANDAKLVDGRPVILPGGKIGKPEGWQPADLNGCV